MKKWKINVSDDALAADFKKKCDLSMLTLKIMTAREYTDFQQLVDFFNETELSDPFMIKDMQPAVDTILAAVDGYDLICVYGDYDCDGVTATVILYNYLESMGANVMYYIPERKNGYGMNMEAVKALAEKGVALIVTVDNGISAHDEAEEIARLGMKLVITDHHQPSETLPKAAAVVNPHRQDCPSVYKELAGVGVALKLCAALDGGNYDLILEQYSDICALGTVADIVPLTGENRTIVRRGLMYMKNSENPGLNFLIDKAGVNRDKLDSSAIAFQISPRINASGRFGSPLTAVKALLSEYDEDAESYVDTLITLNNQRKEAEIEIMGEIMKYVDAKPEILNQRVLVIAGKGWNHGVIGIVSAKLLELYGKPNVLISIEENGVARGSARSVKGFNIFKCFSAASDLLEQFGGHECAGGLTVKEENIEAFAQRVYEYANSLEVMPSAVIECDIRLLPDDITVDNIKGLSAMEPFGADNSQPVFAVLGAKPVRITPLSQGKHTRLDLEYGKSKFQALIFNKSSESLVFGIGDLIDLAVNLYINVYNGREYISAKVLDCRPHSVNQSKYFAAKDAYEKYMRGEQLPENFLNKINPSRQELVEVYKYISGVKEISADDLYMRLNKPAMNYCKLRICIDAFAQSGLVDFSPSVQRVKILPVTHKVELDSAPVLSELRKKL